MRSKSHGSHRQYRGLEKEKSLAKFDEGLAVPVELDALGHDREGERAGEGDERLDTSAICCVGARGR